MFFEPELVRMYKADPDALSTALRDWAAYYCGRPSSFYELLCVLFCKADPGNRAKLASVFPAHALLHKVTDCSYGMWDSLGMNPMDGWRAVYDGKLTLEQILVTLELTNPMPRT